MKFLLRECYIRWNLGEERLRISLNPANIKYEFDGFPAQNQRLKLLANPRIPRKALSILLRAVWEFSDFRIPEEIINRVPIEQTAVFQRMKDISDHRDDLRASHTYRDIRERLQADGIFRHKGYSIRSANEIEGCIHNCFLDLILSMESQGYIEDRTNDFATGGIGTFFIDHDGSILKGGAATHRLAAAKITGLKGGFPARIIGAHSNWLADQNIHDARDLGRLDAAIRAVEVKNNPL